ncbi:hypothetical protein LguiB_024158 [Lonicera macranthoides]
MIPACFSNHNTNSNTSSQAPQNLITCIYQTQLCNSPTQLTLTWSKTLFSHSLTIHPSDHSFSISISLFPSTFSLFKTRIGSKSIYLTHHNYQRIKLFWDFTRAQFAHNSAEPDSCFYIAIICNSRLEFFVGDLKDELTRRSSLTGFHYLPNSTLLSRREHVFGHKSYITRAEFMGSKHEIGIECGGGVLTVKVDDETKLVVKRLAWKFRGNERMTIGGVEIEFYWDVLNWVVQSNNSNGHGVFVFQVGEGGIWPETVGPEKRLIRKSLSLPAGDPTVLGSPASSWSSVLQWAEESSDGGGGRRSSSCSSSTTKSSGSVGGFSLLLYAWRKD